MRHTLQPEADRVRPGSVQTDSVQAEGASSRAAAIITPDRAP